MEAMKPVKVYSSAKRIEAEMLLDVLKNNHIPAYRQGVGSGGYLDICSGHSVFGEEIYVDEGDVQAAKALIEEFVGDRQGDSAKKEQTGSGTAWTPVRICSLLAAVFLIISLIFSMVTSV